MMIMMRLLWCKLRDYVCWTLNGRFLFLCLRRLVMSPPPAELLTKSVSEGHTKTCLFTTEQIVDMMRKPQDVASQSYHFKNLVSCRGATCV